MASKQTKNTPEYNEAHRASEALSKALTQLGVIGVSFEGTSVMWSVRGYNITVECKAEKK